jgi:hypothetical protein
LYGLVLLSLGDEYANLMTQCKEGAQREDLDLHSNEELYVWFTGQVRKNLHFVFTMNPSLEGLKDRAATSPALFNRCVLNWFGDWSDGALFQVFNLVCYLCYLMHWKKTHDAILSNVAGWQGVYQHC